MCVVHALCVVRGVVCVFCVACVCHGAVYVCMQSGGV